MSIPYILIVCVRDGLVDQKVASIFLIIWQHVGYGQPVLVRGGFIARLKLVILKRFEIE